MPPAAQRSTGWREIPPPGKRKPAGQKLSSHLPDPSQPFSSSPSWLQSEHCQEP